MIRQQKQRDKYSLEIQDHENSDQFKTLENFKIDIPPFKPQPIQISFRASINFNDAKLEQDSQKQTFDTVDQRRYKVIQTKEYSNKFLRQATQPNRTSSGTFIRHKNSNLSNLSVITCMKKKMTNKQNVSVRVLAGYEKNRYIAEKIKAGHKKTKSTLIHTPNNLNPINQKISTSRALQMFSKIYKKSHVDNNLTKYRKNFILKTEVQAKSVKLQEKSFRCKKKMKTQIAAENANNLEQSNKSKTSKAVNLINSNGLRRNANHHQSYQQKAQIKAKKRNCASILDCHNSNNRIRKKKQLQFDDDGFALVGWQDN